MSHITVDDEGRSFETFEYPEMGTTTKAVWNFKTKPRFNLVGLQNGRKNQLTKYCSVFDKCDLTNVKVFSQLKSLSYIFVCSEHLFYREIAKC
ncbi:Uncharacterized protein FWK35_00024502 [Aphis craccivora]|uniref:Double jelly roll-like domain-containing protein n=1 Tax=Aphis craccivora TaxID=307492 RepID=A0A6G0VXW0_APHCR|nr:Uncharacterized protein FWK35_00024502 [Aphis craccivora]